MARAVTESALAILDELALSSIHVKFSPHNGGILIKNMYEEYRSSSRRRVW